MGIALIFWLLVKLSQTYQTQRPISFELEIPQEKALTELPPADMVAELEGSGWDLLFDYFSHPTVSLVYDMQDVSRLHLNRGQLRNDIAHELRTNDIKVLEINYDNVLLELEDRNSKTVPIIIQRRLSFAPEHHLKAPIGLKPDSVRISGPNSLIDSIHFWPTDSLILKNLKSSSTVILHLQQPNREVLLSANMVEAKIEVEPFTEKTMYVPLVVKNAPDSLRIFPDKITVTCKLGLSKYDSVSYRDFIAEADLSGISPNAPNNTVPILITQQPDFTRNLQYTPKSAKFFIVEPAKAPN
ncbi:MAG TPA: hypothetical protein PLU64_07570 [Saprospiraceae bacterium]|nr:hypothetical protein [Lewinellaceae bacterium]HQU59037.1 hypothetical protein [Saprospiraceae bacterium]